MPGFGPDTLQFIADLAASPDADFFDANRDRYRQHWLAPARAFVEAVGPPLAEAVPGIHAEPRVHGSILHVRQDVRFGTDRAPYRDHLGLLFWEGQRADATSVLFLRLYADRLTIGAGARSLDQPTLHRYRQAVVDPVAGADLVTAVQRVEEAGWPVQGQTLARGPRNVRSDDPDRARLLRHTAVWAARDLELPGVLGTRRFAGWCVRRWAQLLPLHDWLVDLDAA